MHDYRHDPDFRAAVAAAESGISAYAESDVPDAIALIDRAAGQHNLQGHYNALIPLSVLILRKNPELAAHLAGETDLWVDMGEDRIESRSRYTWEPVQEAASYVIDKDRESTIAERLSGGPVTVDEAANYISRSYGGAQNSGGGGTTVLKRTLKLLAHLWQE